MNKKILAIVGFLIECFGSGQMTGALIEEFADSVIGGDSICILKNDMKITSDNDSGQPYKPSADPIILSETFTLIHPSIGETIEFGNGKQMQLVKKIHNIIGDTSSIRDPEIFSPKSVNIHPSGKKFYVNSLEGGKTIVYSLPEIEKLRTICHSFDETHSRLWAPPSGLFKFRHYSDNLNCFMGKPVESVFSHGGRYLWVPYYRRSFDLNAQDPSALAVIETSKDTIVRIMEAGVLPKMIAVSPDGATIALAHWGDNTVGLIDIKSDNPSDWKYKANIVVGRQLFHDFSLTVPVDRDKNTGDALRGTVFTPDGRYVLVGCMSGGGIAVIDLSRHLYLGKLLGMMPNVRHLVIKGEWIYASINVAGYVQRAKVSGMMKAIGELGESKQVMISDWQTVKVASGARTLEVSPRGDYIFVACNQGSKICIVDSTMRMVGEIAADSYPVGLAVSTDGKWVISTSQGRKGRGGNCVDIFRLCGMEEISEEDRKLGRMGSSSAVEDCENEMQEKKEAIQEGFTILGYRKVMYLLGLGLLPLIISFLLRNGIIQTIG